MIFHWDNEKALENERKHGVLFEEAVEVFLNPHALERFDQNHSTADEERFNIVGFSSRRLLFVVFTLRDTVVRIIHARKANREMQTDYVEQNG